MAESDAVLAGVSIVADLLIEELKEYKKKRYRRKRSVWMREWVARRNALGCSNTFMREVRTEDPDTFRNHLRLTSEQFQELLIKVSPFITKQSTVMREALSPENKLQITLRYLASGDSFSTLEHMYRVPRSTISKFLVYVLNAIYTVLENHIKVPSTPEDWEKVARGFKDRWNFPGCCGAIDGKHVKIQCPDNSDSDLYSYKKCFSTVLFALVDSNYSFLYIDVGSNGRTNDASVFRASTLKAALETNDPPLNFPPWGVIVADDAFPLTTYFMKPYARHNHLTLREKVFNYRLSRARRIVENVFGILASRFRIFLRAIPSSPDKVDLIIKATCALHNWLRSISGSSYIPTGFVDREDIDGNVINGSWRNEIGDVFTNVNHKMRSNNFTREAARRRDSYANYFMTEGKLDWQWNKIH